MNIELHVLLGGAVAAVFILILLIRLISGQRDLVLSNEVIDAYLLQNEPDESITKITISRDHKTALAKTAEGTGFFALRSFGNKLVHQQFSDPSRLKIQNGRIQILRQDISHSALTIEPDTDGDLDYWSNLAEKELPHATP